MERLESLNAVQVFLNQQCTPTNFCTSQRFTILSASIEEKDDRAPSGDLWNRKLSWLSSSRYTNKCITSNAPTSTIFLSLSLSLSLSVTLSYLLTPWSRVLLKKLTVSHLVKKFPPFYKNRRFMSGFTSARHLSQSRTRSMQFMSPHPTFWRSVLILSSYSLSLILKKNLRAL